MNRWTRLFDPVAWAVGGILGVLLLHPAAMLFAGPDRGSTSERLLRAASDSFGTGMTPMIITFAALGVAVALACQVAGALRSETSGAPPERDEEGRPFVRMCMYCKGIPQVGADGKDHWLPLEQALYQTKGLEFSHGVCPHCYKEHLEPQIDGLKRRKAKVQRRAVDAEGGCSPKRHG